MKYTNYFGWGKCCEKGYAAMHEQGRGAGVAANPNDEN
jgi:hypothetical protein